MQEEIIRYVEIKPHEVEFIKNIVGTGKKVIEIGVYAGTTTCALQENNKVYAIDPHEEGYDSKDVASQNMKGIKELFLGKINSNVVYFQMKSEKALLDWKEQAYALIIDGEHSKKALEIDIQFERFVEVVIFHDYSSSWPEVRDFIDEYKKGKEVIGICGSAIAIKRI
jgi:tRNA A58 N-methylase Trm61